MSTPKKAEPAKPATPRPALAIPKPAAETASATAHAAPAPAPAPPMTDEEALARVQEKKLAPQPMRTEFEEQVELEVDGTYRDPDYHYIITPTSDPLGQGLRSPVHDRKLQGYEIVKTKEGDLPCTTDVLMRIPMKKWLDEIENQRIEEQNAPTQPSKHRGSENTEHEVRRKPGISLRDAAKDLPDE